jgi:hypothetical protein
MKAASSEEVPKDRGIITEAMPMPFQPRQRRGGRVSRRGLTQ